MRRLVCDEPLYYCKHSMGLRPFDLQEERRLAAYTLIGKSHLAPILKNAALEMRSSIELNSDSQLLNESLIEAL